MSTEQIAIIVTGSVALLGVIVPALNKRGGTGVISVCSGDINDLQPSQTGWRTNASRYT